MELVRQTDAKFGYELNSITDPNITIYATMGGDFLDKH